MSSRTAITDVVVVGAGFAGLAAATALHTAGVPFLLMEARNRVGGRVEAGINGLREKVDLGGQFICDDMPEVMALARLHDRQLTRAYVAGKSVVQPEPLDPDDLYARVSAIRDRMNDVDIDSESAVGLSVGAWTAVQPDDADAKSGFLSMIEGLWCQPPEDIPLWYMVDNDRRITNDVPELQYFLKDSIHTLAEDLARPLAASMRLSMSVERISQDRNGVVIHAAHETVAARQVIIAVPPVMAGRIAFEPRLPPSLAGALNAWRSGSVIKALLRYATPFWRDSGRSGAVLFLEPHGLYACDASHDVDHPALVVFIGGSLARQWRTLGEAGVRAAIVDHLIPALGPKAAEPVDITLRDWSDDRWSGGAYSDIVVDLAARNAEAAMREGTETVRFACSELSPSFPGYIEGALVAGRQAAAEVIARLDAGTPAA